MSDRKAVFRNELRLHKFTSYVAPSNSKSDAHTKYATGKLVKMLKPKLQLSVCYKTFLALTLQLDFVAFL